MAESAFFHASLNVNRVIAHGLTWLVHTIFGANALVKET